VPPTFARLTDDADNKSDCMELGEFALMSGDVDLEVLLLSGVMNADQSTKKISMLIFTKVGP